MKCDFCSSSEPQWRYDAAEQVIAAVANDKFAGAMHSTGGWLACDQCKRFIERGQTQLLAARCATRLLDARAIELADYLETKLLCQQIHAAFWSARRGPPQRLEARSGP